MSYAIYFLVDTGGAEPVAIDQSYNYTYNCGPMFRRALGGDGIRDLHGKKCGDVTHLLAAAVRHISDPDNAAEYREMNPPSGWGSHEGASLFLSAILSTSREHSKATIHVC